MTATPIAKPRRILLATDLTSRCDRALDRASQLAREWNVELVAAHIVDPANTPQYYLDRSRRRWRKIHDPLERMRWRIRRDLPDAIETMRVVLEEGEPAERLAAIAVREECDLIVTGAAREESVERMLLGSTITRLVRGASSPVLMVQDRGARPYRNITVATDFSEASFQALLKTAAMFPDSRLTLFHAYDIPFAGFVTDRDFTKELQAMEQEVAARVLGDERIDPALRSRVSVEIEHGSPEVLLDDFVEDQHMDLTVIGSHGRGAVFDALIGSTAKRLVEALEGDLLIVRRRDEKG
ncbi:universal stress protein [Hephaestia sp. GCM10023244]|uniref:universal stress protein n=1 Tax=unclassified Hephaestia TaxID=2631281 RepID=UPI002077905E|nr:universal stress protein [Hephaestia sp. MAHUQ-44]MCM8732175.1 universal stress protein [Hephaestia sp. MAHUQ-44]